MNGSSNQTFMSPKNESMLDKLVYQDFQRRLGGELSDKQKARLLKTVHHYMEEVSDKSGSMTIQEMNKQVLMLVVPDYNAYLNRQNIGTKTDLESRIKEDIGSRFTSIQNERSEDTTTRALMPPTPEFRIPLEDESSSSPLSLFERAKKVREAEVLQTSLIAVPPKNLEQTKAPETQSFSGTYLKDLDNSTTPSQTNLAIANPTIAKVEEVRTKPALPQDTIIPQDDILSYKENEYNLVIYSADRDWYNNQRENRYNFSVTFNPANNGQGFKFSPSANMRFHNIVRIEMVKALLPAEAIDTVLANNSSATTISTKPYAETVLSFPTIVLHVDELESNVYGTDDTLDRAFATLQYDAQWTGSSSSALTFPSTTVASVPNTGFFAMIPKFLKCQRIYYPTPLATLTKMTIQLQRPNGDLLNTALDTLDIQRIFASNNLPAGFSAGTSKYASVTDGTYSAYYFIQTKTFFNAFNFVSGDLINIQGINTDLISGSGTAKSDWANYLQSSSGLTIVQVGFLASGTIVTDTPNNANYCNLIVLQNRFVDPTTGTVAVNPFGGSGALNNTFESALATVSNLTGARLINMTKQVQLTFRVITRDMDSGTRIRPNNA
jgi:hypothetical protein